MKLCVRELSLNNLSKGGNLPLKSVPPDKSTPSTLLFHLVDNRGTISVVPPFFLTEGCHCFPTLFLRSHHYFWGKNSLPL